jgi:hypothetical protein
MRVLYPIVWLTIIIVAVATQFSFVKSGPAKKWSRVQTKNAVGERDGKGFAVLELFTSEGCSSCPPADELLAKIQRETAGKMIYILAYHVDYWNRLGWKDVYSSADFSDRQVQYGNWLRVSPIYTPQMIVNGKAQFVGSDESDIRHAISEELAINPDATLTMEASREGEQLKVKYNTARVVPNSRILIAFIQKTAVSKVERGENAGRTLSHVQIVRKLQTERLPDSGSGELAISLPKDFNGQNWEVLGLVQDQSTGEILAAAKADLK